MREEVGLDPGVRVEGDEEPAVGALIPVVSLGRHLIDFQVTECASAQSAQNKADEGGSVDHCRSDGEELPELVVVDHRVLEVLRGGAVDGAGGGGEGEDRRHGIWAELLKARGA